jgi:hypothetical protein
MPGAGVEDFGVSLPTAKTLRARAVCFDPHFGHAMDSLVEMFLINFSNCESHFLQVYS